MKDKPLPEKWSHGLILLDGALRYFRQNGVPLEFVEVAFNSRLRRPPAVIGGDVAAEEPAVAGSLMALARERGRPIRNFGDCQKAKRELGLATVRPENQHAHAVGDWVATVTRFNRRLAQGRIPKTEYESALPTNSAAWHQLVRRWGAEVAPDEGRPRGTQFPGSSENVVTRARESGRPIRNLTDYRRARAEFGEGGAA